MERGEADGEVKGLERGRYRGRESRTRLEGRGGEEKRIEEEARVHLLW